MNSRNRTTRHAFTVITNSYLSRAILLANSLLRHSPSTVLYICILDLKLDKTKSLTPQNVKIIYPIEEISGIKQLTFSYNLIEACTAIKPTVAKHIMERENLQNILYFDPDLYFVSDPKMLWKELDKSSFILTPHMLHPSNSVQGIEDHEINGSLSLGVFNLGFFGVKNNSQGNKILDWWAERLTSYCLDDRQNGLFTDQKWVNLIPLFFDEVTILKHSGVNVASWNIAEREIRLIRGKYVISKSQEPLIFYHFSGYDSGAHYIMLKRYSTNEVPLSLYREYKRKLHEIRKEIGHESSWAFENWNDGKKISMSERNVYRRSKSLQRKYPDPWNGGLQNHFSLYPVEQQKEIGKWFCLARKCSTKLKHALMHRLKI